MDLIKVYDNIIVIGHKKSYNISIFNKSGQLISSISHHGKGPGELSRWSDLGSINDGKTIWVFDRFTNKIHYYDLACKWIRSVTITTKVLNVFFLSNGDLIALNNQYCNDQYDNTAVLLLNGSGEIIGNACNIIPDSPTAMSDLKNIWAFNTRAGPMFKLSLTNDTIYKYHQGKLIPEFVFVQKSKRKKNSKVDQRIKVFNIQTFGDCMFISYYYSGRTRNCLITPNRKCIKVDYILDDYLGLRSRRFLPTNNDTEMYNYFSVMLSKEDEAYLFDKSTRFKSNIQSDILTFVNEYCDDSGRLFIFFQKKHN